LTFEDVAERHAMAASDAKAWRLAREASRPILPRYLASNTEVGSVVAEQWGGDRHAFKDRLRQALGTVSTEFATEVVNKLSAGPDDMSAEVIAQRVNAGLAFIVGAQPQSELEATILLQFWLTHRAFTRHVISVERSDLAPQLEVHNAIAGKMGTLAVRQLEALAKLRGGGKQEVTVTHVHQHVYVADGGQAVVGNLTGGGGGEAGTRLQSQAPALALGHAGGAEVWGQDALGLALQGAEDRRPGPVSDARRSSRSAEGPAERRLEARPEDQRDEGAARGGCGNEPSVALRSGPPLTRARGPDEGGDS
jgi:hypothetical protein